MTHKDALAVVAGIALGVLLVTFAGALIAIIAGPRMWP